jgi:ribonucleoside-diphosphate reductase alpha chain
MLAMFKDMGMVINPDSFTPATWIVDFPMKAPEGAITRKKFPALKQLEHWKSVKVNFCEHNPSATIYVSDNEWIAVGNWVYENWSLIGGLSFMPTDDHVYPLAPFEEITEEQYNKLMETFPQVDDETFAETLTLYEKDDYTTGAQELACVAGVCETSL